MHRYDGGGVTVDEALAGLFVEKAKTLSRMRVFSGVDEHGPKGMVETLIADNTVIDIIVNELGKEGSCDADASGVFDSVLADLQHYEIMAYNPEVKRRLQDLVGSAQKLYDEYVR